MAKYLVEVFGDSLLTGPLGSHPCEENHPLPSPNQLRRKILIKNKKCDPKSCAKFASTVPRGPNPISDRSSDEGSVVCPDLLESIGARASASTTSSDENYPPDTHFPPGSSSFKSYLPPPPPPPPPPYRPRQTSIDEIDDFSDDELPSSPMSGAVAPIEPIPEARAIQAMSDLVVYTVPTKFSSFVIAASRNRSYEMISLVEDRAAALRRQSPKDFLLYNQRQLSRIYPRGTRVDSSNFQPHPFWAVGCQLVALNYQTLGREEISNVFRLISTGFSDVPMQLNLAIFSFNGASGYLQKPSPLCQPRTPYDPATRTAIEDVVSTDIRLKILSGQFFCQDRAPTHVDVKLFGIDADTQERFKRRIRFKDWNGFQAICEENNQFHLDFSPVNFFRREFDRRFRLQIVFPAMASIRIAVFQDDSTLIGQVVLPVSYLRSGFRHVALRNAMNISSSFASLFVSIERNVHLDAGQKKIANIFVRPILTNESPSAPSSPPISEVDLNRFVRHHTSGSTESTTSLSDRFVSSAIRFHPGAAPEPNLDSSFSSSSSSISNVSSPVFSEQIDWYRKHLIASSAFQRPNELSRLINVNELEQRDALQRLRKEMKTNVKNFTDDQDKVNRNERNVVCTSPFDQDLKTKEEKFQRVRLGAYRPRSQSHQTILTSSEPATMDEPERDLIDSYKKSFHRQEEFESTLLMNVRLWKSPLYLHRPLDFSITTNCRTRFRTNTTRSRKRSGEFSTSKSVESTRFSTFLLSLLGK